MGSPFIPVLDGAKQIGWHKQRQVWQRNADSGGAYQLAATGTGKALDITYSPTTPGSPVQLQVYVQLRKNNENYGQPSEIGLATVNP